MASQALCDPSRSWHDPHAQQPWARAEPLVLTGDSPGCHTLTTALERVARTPRTTVLVRGEPGAGRSQLARALHRRSSRRDGALVVIRAADQVQGDFARRVFGSGGQLEGAAGGTVVLQAVETLDPASQAALLDWLVEPRADVRLVATSSQDLESWVEGGRLRADLFYRLNVLTLWAPPLRERLEDLEAMVRTLVNRLAAELGRRAPDLGPEVLTALSRHPWPGNLRELRAVLEAALWRGGGTLALEDLGLAGAPAPNSEALPLGDRSLRGVEERLIRRVLAEVAGNRSQAARVLGINRQTLYNKLRSYGL